MSEQGLGEHRLRFDLPYSLGVYLAVNALQGAFLIVDGPDCAFQKAQHLSRHDSRCTLLDPSGDHRIAFSGADGKSPGRLAETLHEVGRLAAAEILLITSLPPVDRPAPSGSGARPTVHVPGRSLEGDWLHGYAATLQALAEALPLDARPRPDTIAIVGYLYDRHEADHAANLGELRGLLAGMGLELTSVWLGGAGTSELARVAEAQTILSLPYGREAARILSKRAGAKLIELDLPLGLGGSCDWLRELGRELGREREAESLIARGLGESVPRLQRLVGRVIFGQRFLVALDPFLAAGVCGMLSELGASVTTCIVPASREHLGALARRDAAALDAWVCEPREQELEALVAAHRQGPAIGTSELATLLPRRYVELGFPSVHHHALAPSPFFGFAGALGLAQRIVNELLRPEGL